MRAVRGTPAYAKDVRQHVLNWLPTKPEYGDSIEALRVLLPTWITEHELRAALGILRKTGKAVRVKARHPHLSEYVWYQK